MLAPKKVSFKGSALSLQGRSWTGTSARNAGNVGELGALGALGALGTVGAVAAVGAFMGALFAFLSLAPALWLSQAVSHLSHQQVLLSAPSGTIWSGSAQLALSSGDKSSPALGLPSRLEWRIHPLWLSTQEAGGSFWSVFWSEPLTLALELQAPCCLEPNFRVTVKPQGLALLISPPKASIQLPAQWLDGLGAPWNTLQPKGRLTLQNHNLELLLGHPEPQLSGRLELKMDDLSSRLSTVKPLGSYRVWFNSQSSPQIELSSVAESRLLLSGRGQWVHGRLHFEGLADTAASDEETLSNLLNVLGQRTGHQAQLRID